VSPASQRPRPLPRVCRRPCEQAAAMRDKNSGGRVTKRAWTSHMNKLVLHPKSQILNSKP